ncbi:MAG: hypothetical protein JJT88_01760 [Gammaproteobacteria bacterium]|nr:hypothetical protein [Gammaproteobacteria bacterium]
MLLLGALSACSTQGTFVEEEEAFEFEQSITSAADLTEVLGIPSVTVPMDDGSAVWIYEGIHKRPNAAAYIPYVSILASGNDKTCTRLSVRVHADGSLSDWSYVRENATEHWTRKSDRCTPTAPRQRATTTGAAEAA